MALYDPDHRPETTPKDKIAIVHDFLTRCRGWGTEREIPKYLDRLAADPGSVDAAKLHAWTSFVDFLDHTLRELEDGTLDPWFAPDPPA